MRTVHLFTLFGLKTTISPVGVVSYLISIPVTGWLAASARSLSWVEAALAGVLSAVVMFVSGWLHQLGHARAARDTGYPMVGVHFFSLFSASRYPPGEPPLPPSVHIRRALGGFWVNLLIGLLLLPIGFFAWFEDGVRGWVFAFAALYNLGVLGLGSLLPVDIPGVFTDDGGTLLRYWRERRAEKKRSP